MTSTTSLMVSLPFDKLRMSGMGEPLMVSLSNHKLRMSGRDQTH